MRIARPWQEENEPVPITPFIDVVFNILILFMVTAVFAGNESEIDILLPTADTAVQTSRSQGEIYINIRADGGIVVNNQEMDLPALQGVLDRVAKYFPGGAVIIRGDAGVDLGKAISVLDCCRKADIQNVSFAAVPENASAQ